MHMRIFKVHMLMLLFGHLPFVTIMCVICALEFMCVICALEYVRATIRKKEQRREIIVMFPFHYDSAYCSFLKEMFIYIVNKTAELFLVYLAVL